MVYMYFGGQKRPSLSMANHELDLMFICLFVCWNKTRKTTLCLLCWEESKPPESDHTRAEAQTTCVPKTATHTTYLSIYGWHSTSWWAGLHLWTWWLPLNDSSGVPPCFVVWRVSFGRGERLTIWWTRIDIANSHQLSNTKQSKTTHGYTHAHVHRPNY